MDICIDFDGTCVTHEYPDIGKDIGSISVLNKIVSNGHNLILFTMRSGVEEMEAVNWFIDNHIPLYGVNKNPSQQTPYIPYWIIITFKIIINKIREIFK